MTQSRSQREGRARMLREVFPHDTRLTPEYLAWEYERSPEGSEFSTDMTDGERYLAHYAVIPQTWEVNGRPIPLVLSLNTAVTEGARGKGAFTNLAEQTYAKARDLGGAQGVLGVGNAKSTPGLVRRLGFTLVTPLPVVVGIGVPRRGRDVRTLRGTPEVLTSAEFDRVAATIGAPNDGKLRQLWTPAKLRWRLESPAGPFMVHVHDTAILISKRTSHWGVPLVLALAFLPRSGATHVAGRALIDAACAAHRSPFFLYAGLNSAVRLTGLPLLDRLKPSPLNLCCRSLAPSFPADVSIGRFEFLDFDAY